MSQNVLVQKCKINTNIIITICANWYINLQWLLLNDQRFNGGLAKCREYYKLRAHLPHRTGCYVTSNRRHASMTSDIHVAFPNSNFRSTCHCDRPTKKCIELILLYTCTVLCNTNITTMLINDLRIITELSYLIAVTMGVNQFSLIDGMS